MNMNKIYFLILLSLYYFNCLQHLFRLIISLKQKSNILYYRLQCEKNILPQDILYTYLSRHSLHIFIKIVNNNLYNYHVQIIQQTFLQKYRENELFEYQAQMKYFLLLHFLYAQIQEIFYFTMTVKNNIIKL